MKGRHLILALAAAALVFGLGGNALAFHSGGVAECSGCHSMHSPFVATGADNLLFGAEGSSACLRCHQRAGDTGPSSYHISTPDTELTTGVSPKQRTPGGDFGWLHKTYTWSGRGSSTETEEGHTHGHNIIATQGYDRSTPPLTVTYNYAVDPVNGTAPGGTFNANNLGCQSCHNPHGQSRRLADGSIVTPDATLGGMYLPIVASGSYNTSPDPAGDVLTNGTAVGVYRLLGGDGYSPTTGGVTFPGNPDAVAPSTYNQSEATNQVKVAYGRATGNGHATWSQWCGACHPNMHYDNGAKYVHPTDEPLNGSTYNNYNAYVKSGDLTGVPASSFTSLVPTIYNKGGLLTDYNDATTGLKAYAGNGAATYAGPESSNDRVDCLSCHRAHASGWEYALRWNPEYEFLTDSNGDYYNGGYGGRGRTSAEVEDSYYDRPSSVFAKSQRSLCNKCHVKD